MLEPNRWAWRPQAGPQKALVVRLRSFAVKLSWRRPIVSISAAKSSSCSREHPRTAHGIHAANVGLFRYRRSRGAMSGARSQAVWVAAAAAGLEVVTGAGLVVAPSLLARLLFGSEMNASGARW